MVNARKGLDNFHSIENSIMRDNNSCELKAINRNEAEIEGNSNSACLNFIQPRDKLLKLQVREVGTIACNICITEHHSI